MNSYNFARSISNNNTYNKLIKKQNKNTSDSSSNNINYKITRINIDSRHRIHESKNIVDNNVFYLSNNPLSIIYKTSNDSELIINHPNHLFKPNDNIVIQGAESISVNLTNAITFIGNSSYARIIHKSHGLYFNTNNVMYIEISNFIGNQNNNTDFNNIPINKINSMHKIYPVKDSKELINDDYYYIYLDSIIANFSSTYNLSAITITFKDINGINLNVINANYPTNINQINGYHVINDVTNDTYSISLNITNDLNIYNKGGNNIWVAKVNEFIEGYKDNNFYKIALKKTFINIAKIKLISTEFPNTEKIIKSSGNKKNNMLYWKLENDGERIYNISLNAGNYSISLLESSIKSKVEEVIRDTLKIINKNTLNYSYYDYNQCNVKIEPRTDTFSIEFYTTIFYPNSITYKEPNIYTDNIGRLIITHPNHRLDVNTVITITNAIATDGIPQDVINNNFKIEKIINENTYQVKLPKYNISASNTNTTNGGNSMAIKYPIKSQLLFDRSDTIGNVIGFKNSGKSNAITNYNYINTNKDLYYNDIDDIPGNLINLSGDNYILMSSPIFTDSTNSGKITNIFAKLLLSSEPGTVIYNQFIQLGEKFNPLLNELSEWQVTFYDANDELYDFGNLEHSYTLEIYEIIN